MQIAPDQIDPDAAKVVQRLRRFDHAAYLVGGCVRDLLLGRKPKDFDVATSATPNEIKRLFRNCRIIGRRFRLAHVFFGPKIIETSTFRANPRDRGRRQRRDRGRERRPADPPRQRVRHPGARTRAAATSRSTASSTTSRRGEVIDHVGGMADLEARLVRTIGDPDIRFREDPVRILRAIKFAARCELTIEPETYRRMMEHRQEIAKCAQARVSEEFYRLLRAGAAKRSMELLVETDLLDIFAPEIARGLMGEPDRRRRGRCAASAALGIPGRARSHRRRCARCRRRTRCCWRCCCCRRCATRWIPTATASATSASSWRRRSRPRSSGCVPRAATASWPARSCWRSATSCRRATRAGSDRAWRGATSSTKPCGCRDGFGRRGRGPSLLGRPIVAEGTTLGDGLPGEGEAEEIAAPELEPLDDYDERRRRRGRGGRGPDGRGPEGRGPEGVRLHPRPVRGEAPRAEPARLVAPIATDLRLAGRRRAQPAGGPAAPRLLRHGRVRRPLVARRLARDPLRSCVIA